MNTPRDPAPHVRIARPKPRLNPKEASEHLRAEHGLTYAVSTLAKFRTIGGGPSFYKLAQAILYDRAELDRWAAEKLGQPLRSTSDVGEH